MPRDQLFQRKVPVMLTDAQVDWLDEYRWAHRFEGRAEAIRALIDRERQATSTGADGAAPSTAPAIKPYSPDTYPGQGFAPLIVPFLIRTARTSYSEEELVTEARHTMASIQPGQLAAIRNTMRSCGFRAATKRLPGKPRESLWEYG
jgi:hypothetical protein